MIASTGTATPTTRAAVSPNLNRLTGALLLLQFAIFAVALVVLGSAINWPASLGEPPSIVLPLILAQSGSVALGYTSYLASALLLIPIALLVRTGLAERPTTLLTVGAAFGTLAGVLKLLGIARWLVVMPSLAVAYADPAASAATRSSLELLYNAINHYAGGLGEVFGVMLFSGLWTVLVSVALLRSGRFPRWLGLFGLGAGAVLIAGFAEVFGVDFGPAFLTLSGVIWQLWMISTGVAFLRARP
jgi:hypothetical protein